jgi:hypothetical protein
MFGGAFSAQGCHLVAYVPRALELVRLAHTRLVDFRAEWSLENLFSTEVVSVVELTSIQSRYLRHANDASPSGDHQAFRRMSSTGGTDDQA